jgi:hypothetical protein
MVEVLYQGADIAYSMLEYLHQPQYVYQKIHLIMLKKFKVEVVDMVEVFSVLKQDIRQMVTQMVILLISSVITARISEPQMKEKIYHLTHRIPKK